MAFGSKSVYFVCNLLVKKDNKLFIKFSVYKQHTNILYDSI